jgi:enoyl-CoA hydratase
MAVRVERAGPVTTVIMDRPQARNAVNTETAQDLVDAFAEFEADPAASVAVFWGAGGTFCAGGDLREVQQTGALRWLNDIEFPGDDGAPAPNGPMGPSRLELTKPVIAAVAGAAVAGGMELAMWCDVRIAEEDAFFGVYCRRWGIPFLDGGTVRLPRLVGQGRATEIILTGRTVPAAEALRIGLCEQVVPTGQARQAAEAMAREIARFPQACVRADLASVRRQYGKPLRQALREEFVHGKYAMQHEGVAGASRFTEGKGRHGDYVSI